jgi:nucleoside 2-deoxyribosyltransferase
LGSAVKRLHDEAEKLLTESPHERREREDDEQTNRRFQTGLDACDAVLIELDERA